jgi:hypothetical protein
MFKLPAISCTNNQRQRNIFQRAVQTLHVHDYDIVLALLAFRDAHDARMWSRLAEWLSLIRVFALSVVGRLAAVGLLVGALWLDSVIFVLAMGGIGMAVVAVSLMLGLRNAARHQPGESQLLASC